MPGYTIHLAVGKVYQQNNEIIDVESFEKGIIAPDLSKDKGKSHYGEYSSNPDLDRYLRERNITNEFDEGYFLHLVTDYLFYNKYLKKWDKFIYDDYDKLNNKLIEKYRITIPKELLDVVKTKDGELTVLNEADIYKFIDAVGRINVRKMLKDNRTSLKSRMAQIQFKERE